jgi:chorismate dehydratase
VAYLNARPLTYCLAGKVPGAEIILDLPSRLADALSRAELDVALVPSIEYFRIPGSVILSDVCIACEGAVKSVKLFGRTPIGEMKTLALDEGSRTSAALARILLKERFKLEPQLERLPAGVSLLNCSADAVLLIGDRGILPPEEKFEFVWDLGEEWTHWTGLPFVFALWVARPGLDCGGAEGGLGEAFASARDEGLGRLEEIARVESPRVGISEEECLSYFCDHLRFRLGRRERNGLETFCRLAVRHGLAPAEVNLVFSDRVSA